MRHSVAGLVVIALARGTVPAAAEAHVPTVAATAETAGQSEDRRSPARVRKPKNSARPAGVAAPAPDLRPGAGKIDHQTGLPNPSIPSIEPGPPRTR